MRRGAAAALAGALLLGATTARAGAPEARAAAEQSFRQAEEAARAQRYAEALAAYRAAFAADPSAGVATTARARAADLEAHAEGDFGPLARLSAVRREPARGRDRAEIEALGRDAEGFPPGRVRAEARIFVAEAWWRQLGEPARALGPLEAVVADGSGDRVTRALALSELCALRRERGELREALRVAEAHAELSPALRAELARLVRRERLHAGAVLWLGALLVVGLGSAAWLSTRARDVRDLPGKLLPPAAVAVALYLGGAGALLVRLHGEADPRPFVWLGAALLPLAAGARAFLLAAGRRPGVRAIWAAACVIGVTAAAFLSVEQTTPEHLSGMGL